jgi:hypothetical protein
MKFQAIGKIATSVACIAMALPLPAFAVSPAAPATNDVALRAGGLLVGQVLDQQGVAKTGTPVSVQFAGKEVVTTTSDANGVFAAKGLRGGQYQLVTPQGASVCRLWAPETAPPSARPAALVISGNEVVRAQGGGPINSWVCWAKMHPYIVAGTVTAAIAVPVALASTDFGSGS